MLCIQQLETKITTELESLKERIQTMTQVIIFTVFFNYNVLNYNFIAQCHPNIKRVFVSFIHLIYSFMKSFIVAS